MKFSFCCMLIFCYLFINVFIVSCPAAEYVHIIHRSVRFSVWDPGAVTRSCINPLSVSWASSS